MASALESLVISGFANQGGALVPAGWRKINFSGFLASITHFEL
jgi:hypothetical protein